MKKQKKFDTDPLGYKVEGTYDDKGTMNLDIFINTEEENNEYVFIPQYNLTKNTTTGKINAVLIFMTKASDEGADIGMSSPHHNETFFIDRLADYGIWNTEFDYDLDEALIILFHTNKYSFKYAQYFFKDIKKYYNMAKSNGGFCQVEVPDLVSPEFLPRTAGMTIIKKGRKDDRSGKLKK